MQYEVKEISPTRRQFTVKVEGEELTPYENRVSRAFQKKVSLPGFRPGRVPLNLIKKRFRDEIISKVIDEALQEFFYKALSQSKIQPVSTGVIQNVKFNDMQSGLEFDFEIEVEPEIEIKKYKGLKVEKEMVVVTDEMVNRAIGRLQENFATVKTAEIVEKGSLVTVTLQQLGEGDVPMVGRKYEDITLEIGSGKFDAEIEEQLIGLKAGEETIVRKVISASGEFPEEESHVESYKITVQDIQEQELPPLDDEFVKNLGDEEIETMDQLRTYMEESIRRDLEQRSEKQFRSRLIDELLKENPFEVPDAMVDNYLNHIIEDIQRSTQEKLDKELIRQRYRADAVRDIRWYLLKKKLMEVEDIDISEEEIMRRIDNLNISDEDKKKAKADSRILEDIRNEILEEKLFELLKSEAEIIEVYPQPSEEDSVAGATETPQESRIIKG